MIQTSPFGCLRRDARVTHCAAVTYSLCLLWKIQSLLIGFWRKQDTRHSTRSWFLVSAGVERYSSHHTGAEGRQKSRTKRSFIFDPIAKKDRLRSAGIEGHATESDSGPLHREFPFTGQREIRLGTANNFVEGNTNF